MKFHHLIQRFVLYAAVAGLAVTAAGCSQGPIDEDEAEELRSQLKTMRQELTQVQDDLTALGEKPDDERTVREQVQQLRDQLGTMTSSLSDIEEALKPPEPQQPPAGQTAPGGGGMGGAGGQAGGGAY